MDQILCKIPLQCPVHHFAAMRWGTAITGAYFINTAVMLEESEHTRVFRLGTTVFVVAHLLSRNIKQFRKEPLQGLFCVSFLFLLYVRLSFHIMNNEIVNVV